MLPRLAPSPRGCRTGSAVSPTIVNPRPRIVAAGLTGLLVAWLVAGPGRASAAEPQGAAKKSPRANRLARETSPYLLLHAHNPVDWYPWGPEAFERAKAEKKPIFLSVGYSSCYWCHVMERESFSDPAIARTLNENFICIKVDREERPDVDQVYMAALQVFGSGGWPMSMFLTSDGRPFFGGTYFPPKDRDGLEGFPSMVQRVLEAWRDHRAEIERDAERLSSLVRRSLVASTVLKRKGALSRQIGLDGRAALAEQFDPEYGGFGFSPDNARRPKFPEPVNLVFLLDQHRRDRLAAPNAPPAPATATEPTPLDMVLKTLDHMARGGIRDQLAGGYHRYATSRYWIVPHFEKMLYDNAQLASAHLMAFELTGDTRWADEARATFAFLARTMTAPEGGFYSALDAETGGEEGAYYVWTRDEIRQVLGEGPDVDAFSQVYGLRREPNFVNGRHVLLEPRPRAEQAASLKLTPEQLETRIAPLRDRLLQRRDQRPAPLRDDKILTSWNGLAIAAHADGFRLLKDDRYRQAAEKAADFLWSRLRDREGRLLRTYRAGQAKLPAYLEDYAFLAHGLLRLHAATGDPKRLEQARTLADRMMSDFADDQEGGFFFTADDHESLIARSKDPNDNVLPSGNSVAVRVLVALARATQEARYLDFAGKTLEAFSGPMTQSPASMPLMLVALGEYLDARPETVVAPGSPRGEAASEVVSVTASAPIPVVGVDDTTVTGAVVKLTVRTADGWHVYANPTGVAELQPTRVVLDPGQPWSLDRVKYPAGVAKTLESSGKEKVALYEGQVELTVFLKAAPGAAQRDLSSAPIRLTVRFQACDDRRCLAPAEQKVVAAWPQASGR
ncbi:MAG: DUF255 domain-containing protein [Isosphaeraceae bacterium]